MKPRRKRRNHNAGFKAKVAIAALKGDKTLAELAHEYDVHLNQITDWKNQLITNSAVAFDASPPVADLDVDIERLHATIGRLKVENDFLERALTKAGYLSVKK